MNSGEKVERKMKKRLAIIPARGGSKGIPKKNIYNVAGHPLIYYTIEAAKEAKEAGAVDRVIVSTDSGEIADVARACGAEVPFMRPDRLSSDKSKSADLMIHAVANITTTSFCCSRPRRFEKEKTLSALLRCMTGNREHLW